MNAAVRSKSVQRITVLQPDPAGGFSAVKLYDRKTDRKKKKVSRRQRPLERLVRQLANAQSTAAQSFLDRHQDSRRKKKGRWLRDLGRNTRRANRKGAKKIKVSRIFR